MPKATSCAGGRWCERADALFDVEVSPVSPVSSFTATGTGVLLRVETGEGITGCLECGVVAVGQGRPQVRLHDIP
ncbi:hypothetical protein E5206_06195 [Arthrobacter sp. PAMC25564]|uniref:hypothetical protein n=1 Tax=Arthrobacter sp. PAMC25564 TaxID=2565366 RepID=UPI0010A23FFF|nr:hypothetical protein [Arthrobacter sp. PAMC25564]QCB96567.1 hypothetical protein E5206_06195 [Arthrobacter sp. PAMC25564]